MLNSAGLREIRQIAHISPDLLSMFIGGGAAQLRLFANGIDDRRVTTERETKSISAEITFEHDVGDAGELSRALLGLCERVAKRLKRAGLPATRGRLRTSAAPIASAPGRSGCAYAA